MITEVNENNPIVIGQEPVLLDFYATWCGPCKMTGKNLEEFTRKHPEITIYKINVDEYEDIAEQHGIMNLPTLICKYTPVGEKDKELWRHTGLMTAQQLEKKLYESKK